MNKAAPLITVLAIMEGLFVSTSQVSAADPQGTATKLKVLERTVARQEKRIAELETAVSEEARQRIRHEEIRKIIKEVNDDASKRGGLPNWLDNLKLYGDLRLRYEGHCYNGDTKNRNLGRFRLRFGATKTWLDKQLEVGFRLASGSDADPTSTNQTFDVDFSKKHVWIDLAYAKYAPKAIKGLTVIGGKMKKPFVHTDMVWAGDVNPEGVWAQYKVPGLGKLEPFAGAGAFQLMHNTDDHDATLLAYQAGVNWKITKDIKWTSAVTYYDFSDYEDNYTRAGGNTELNAHLTAEEFNVFNLTNKVSWKAFGMPMSAYVDYLHNCGNELAGESDALAVGYKLGKNKAKGDWSIGYKYAHIEANSTPGGFNDGGFGRSNRKGHVASGKYNITDYLTVGVSLYHTQPVSGDDTGDTTTSAVADLVWKF